MVSAYLALVLVLVWCGFSGDFSWPNMVIGFGVTLLCMRLVPATNGERIAFRPWWFFELVVYMIGELVLSSFRVAWEIIQPNAQRQPAILKVPFRCKTDFEKAIMASLLSLTPGTISIDIVDGKQCLLIHAMFARSEASMQQQIKASLEKRVIRTFGYE